MDQPRAFLNLQVGAMELFTLIADSSTLGPLSLRYADKFRENFILTIY
jgi:hypothetical protein